MFQTQKLLVIFNRTQNAGRKKLRLIWKGLDLKYQNNNKGMKSDDEKVIVKFLFMMGPSGSGKTSLSKHLASVYQQLLGNNTVTLASLDPANYLSSGNHIQINDLVNVEDVMEEYGIGPNASIFYCMDFVLENIEWLQEKIQGRLEMAAKIHDKHGIKYPYHLIIYDLPGQIELYINSNIVKEIISKLTARLKKKYLIQPCVLELFDCTYMHDLNQFLSLCMMSLATMINLQMPHLNLLNKIDLLKHSQAKPSRGLINQYFCMPSAAQLVEELKPLDEEGQETNADNIAKILDAYGQVSFLPCSLYKSQLILNVIHELQNIFGTLEISSHHPFFQNAVGNWDIFSHQRALTALQNQLGEDEEAELSRMQADMQKDRAANGAPQ